jgi:hypothetical protein
MFVNALAMQFTGWPDPHYFPNITHWSSHDVAWRLIWANFCLYFLQPAVSVLTMYLKSPLLGNIIPYALISLIGVAAVSTGIAAAVEGSKAGVVNVPYDIELAIDGLNLPAYALLIGPLRKLIWDTRAVPD